MHARCGMEGKGTQEMKDTQPSYQQGNRCHECGETLSLSDVQRGAHMHRKCERSIGLAQLPDEASKEGNSILDIPDNVRLSYVEDEE